MAFLWWLARNRLTTGAFSPAKLLAAVAGRSKSDELGDQLQFRLRFAGEFHDMSNALSRPRLMLSPLVVFIDDLDRCRSENVLDVLEAVNFLVTSGICYVVIGMDRDRVEACIGLGFKDVANKFAEAPVDDGQELTANTNQPAKPKAQEDAERVHEERRQRRTYARDYLEKIINIEVLVPALVEDGAGRLFVDGAEGAILFARWLLKGAMTIEKYFVWALLFEAILSIGGTLMLSQVSDATDQTSGESWGGVDQQSGVLLTEAGEALSSNTGQSLLSVVNNQNCWMWR